MARTQRAPRASCVISSALFAAAAACQPAPIRVQVPFPAGAQSEIVAVSAPDGLSLYTVDDATRAQTPLLRSVHGFTGEPPLKITVLPYAEPLSAHRWAPGPLDQAPSGTPSVPLSGYLQPILEARVDADGTSPFAPVGQLPSDILSVRLPIGDRCLHLHGSTSMDLPSENRIVGAIALTATSALVITSAGTSSAPSFFAADATGVRRADLALPPMIIDHVASSTAGGLLLAGVARPDKTPVILSGRPGLGFSALPSRPAPATRAAAIAPARGDGEPPAALYVLDGSGRIDRYDGAAWAPFADLGGAYAYGPALPLAWHADHVLFAISADERSVVRVLPAELIPERSSLSGAVLMDFSSAVADIPGVGTFQGSVVGGLAFRDLMGQWTTLRGGLLSTNEVRILLPLPDGVLAAGDEDTLDQWFADTGFCPPQPVGTDASVRAVVVLDQVVIVAAVGRLKARPPFITILPRL